MIIKYNYVYSIILFTYIIGYNKFYYYTLVLQVTIKVSITT
jgi:hypothetical protein